MITKDDALRREAEMMVTAWLEKEYWPNLSHQDSFHLPKEIVEAREILGREEFKALFKVTKPRCPNDKSRTALRVCFCSNCCIIKPPGVY